MNAQSFSSRSGGGGRRWTPKRVDALCDCVADGFTFKEAAAMIGMPAAACREKFAEIRSSLGEQGS